MRIEEIDIEGRGALVFTMSEHVRLGRDRLEAMRAADNRSAVDDSIQRAVRGASQEIELLILRGGSDDGVGSWRFDESLTNEECEELGHRLLISQLDMYRECVGLGVLLFVKVEWGPREMAGLDEGRRRMLAELESTLDAPSLSDALRARLELDAWILRTFSYWLLSSLEDSRPFLARSLARASARRARVDKLLEDAELLER